jgi:hypothetical protein
LIEGAVADADSVIRRMAYDLVVHSPDATTRDRLMQRAQTDPIAAIRHTALDYWAARSTPTASAFVYRSLFDSAPEVRTRARSVWRRRSETDGTDLTDIADIYRAAVSKAKGRHLVGPVSGLGETGTTTDAAIVRAYIHYPKSRVRVAAIRAAWRLDPKGSRPTVINALLLDSPSVAREARHCLEAVLSDIDVASIWTRATMAPDGVSRRRLLVLFRQLGKWERLIYILTAVPDPDPETASFALSELHSWNAGFNKTFTRLLASDRNRLRDLAMKAAPVAPGSLLAEVGFTIEHA